MARPIVLSNGELHVGLNTSGLVHDFYYPYVGLENHSAGPDLAHKIGVFVDNQISWMNVDNDDWQISLQYPHSALVGCVLAKNERLGIILEFDDFVDSSLNAFLRNIHVINLFDHPREVRLFLNQAFAIGDSRSNTDTVQYLPGSDAILHYRGRRAFVISGRHNDKPFDQHAVGIFGIEGKEGTHKDAEDGELSMSSVEHGRVDSTIRFKLNVPAHSSQRVNYWIAAGTSTREALQINKQIREDSLAKRLRQTVDWWQQWLEPAYNVIDRIPTEHQSPFIKSLMIIKSQIDKRGAILASTDTTMLSKHSRDAYAYTWPRDGALILWPLIRLGYTEEPRHFFEFCKRALQQDGHLMHKYRADGALGSSWHPYTHKYNIIGPPIQEDETALVLFMFAQFYAKNPDLRLLEDFYKSMIIPMADFLAEYIDPQLSLPKPSYDLWEEVYLTTTFSTGATYGALVAASELAGKMNDQINAVKWRASAEDIKDAAHKHLVNHERQAFYKGVLPHEGKILERDSTVDSSSLFGAFMFGLFDINSPEVKNAAKTTKEALRFSEQTPALPRYENDYYFRSSETILGNYWHITSLWLAQYELETGDDKTAQLILNWVKRHMLSTAVLSEQVDPLNNQPVSVAPLTWSHAEYIATLLDSIADHTSD